MKAKLFSYVAFVVAGAAVMCGALLFLRPFVEPWWLILVWALSSWLSDIYPVEMKKVNGNAMLLGLSMTFNLSAAVLFSPSAAMLVGFISGTSTSGIKKWYKILFNASQIAISTALASLVYHGVYPTNSNEITRILVIGLAIATYAISNNSLVAGAVSLASGKRFLGILKDVLIDFFGASIFIALAIAYIIIYLYPYTGLWIILVALGPLLVVRVVLDLYRKFLNSKLNSMYALLKALEEKDLYTAGHGERVAKYCEIIGERLGIEGKRLEELKMAAQLHDVGKIGIRDKVLNKPGKLSMDEFQEIKSHPLKGAEIVGEVPAFGKMVPWIRYHHEHWDGSGYPEGIKGKEIPIEAMIIEVADVYDALTTQRAYRKAFDVKMALQIMKNESGKTFDPVVLAAFFDVIDQIEEARIEMMRKREEKT